MQDFQKLDVWQRAHQCTLDLYRATASFPPHEKYGLAMQMRRAAVSIESNIAEGCGRSSDADFARFLHNAIGSANELQCQLLIARDLGYLAADASATLETRRSSVKHQLLALVAAVKPGRAQSNRGPRP